MYKTFVLLLVFILSATAYSSNKAADISFKSLFSEELKEVGKMNLEGEIEKSELVKVHKIFTICAAVSQYADRVYDPKPASMFGSKYKLNEIGYREVMSALPRIYIEYSGLEDQFNASKLDIRESAMARIKAKESSIKNLWVNDKYGDSFLDEIDQECDILEKIKRKELENKIANSQK